MASFSILSFTSQELMSTKLRLQLRNTLMNRIDFKVCVIINLSRIRLNHEMSSSSNSLAFNDCSYAQNRNYLKGKFKMKLADPLYERAFSVYVH